MRTYLKILEIGYLIEVLTSQVNILHAHTKNLQVVIAGSLHILTAFMKI